MRRALSSEPSWDDVETVARPLPFLPRTSRIVSFDDAPEPDYDDAETINLGQRAFRPPPAPAPIDPVLGKTRSVPAMKTYQNRTPSIPPAPVQKPEQQAKDEDRPKLVSLGASYGVQGVWIVVVAVTLLAFMKIIPAAFARFDSIATTIHTNK